MEEIKTTKVCPKCGRELPVNMFHKKIASKDGLQSECVECRKQLNLKKGSSRMLKVYLNPELARFTPKDLISELRARGYKGELSYTQKITV